MCHKCVTNLSQMCHFNVSQEITRVSQLNPTFLHTPACTPRASESLRFVGPSRAKDHRSQKMTPATGIHWDTHVYPNGIAIYRLSDLSVSNWSIYWILYPSIAIVEFQLFIQFRIHPLRWASPSWDDGIFLQIPSISVGEKFQLFVIWRCWILEHVQSIKKQLI